MLLRNGEQLLLTVIIPTLLLVLFSSVDIVDTGAGEAVDFLAPVRGGDYLEIEAEITRVGKTSREMRFEARKVIAPGDGSSARLLDPAEVVARATGTCVVPLEKQRRRP